jgi:hypothetical protein
MEKISMKGRWFLPGKADEAVFGILDYDPTGVTRLEVFEPLFELTNRFETPEIILGYGDGKKITLYRCDQTTKGSQEIYYAMYIFLGYHFETADDLLFDSCDTKFFNLEQWLNVYSFEQPPQEGEKPRYGAFFEAPADIPLFSAVDHSTKITHGSRHSYKDVHASFTQHSLFNITRTDSPASFEWFIDEIYSFLKLLTLCSFEACPPTSVHFMKGDTKIEVRYNSPVVPLSKPLDHHAFVIPYNLIKDQLPEIMNFYNSKREELEPIVNLLVDSIFNRGTFDENRFLDIARAIETFHRTFRSNALDLEKVQRFNEIYEDSREKNKPWLKDKLGQWTQPSLGERLRSFMLEFRQGIFKPLIPEPEKVISNTKNSRQYYTHLLRDYKKKAVKHSDLFNLTRTLQFMLLAAVLIETGIPQDKVLQSLDHLKFRFFHEALKSQ